MTRSPFTCEDLRHDHGRRARRVLLADESACEFAARAGELHATLAPVGALRAETAALRAAGLPQPARAVPAAPRPQPNEPEKML